MPHIDAFVAQALTRLPESIRQAVVGAKLPGLGEGPADSALANLLLHEPLVGDASIDSARAPLVMSGLWLLAGDLDRSHSISQGIGSADGSFWHGIMHRREGDFGNAKYWFRRVGSHPVLEQLPILTDGDYADPFDFVDDCSRAIRSGGEAYQRCQRAQWLEWQALMTHCLR